MEQKFFYHRDKERRPIITECVITDGEHRGIGLAICSPLDSVKKSEGRRHAEHRALRAIKKKMCSDPINRKEAVNRMGDVSLADPNFRYYPFTNKSVYQEVTPMHE